MDGAVSSLPITRECAAAFRKGGHTHRILYLESRGYWLSVLECVP